MSSFYAIISYRERKEGKKKKEERREDKGIKALFLRGTFNGWVRAFASHPFK